MTAKSFEVEKTLLRASLDNLLHDMSPKNIKGFMGVSCFVNTSRLPVDIRNEIISEAFVLRKANKLKK